MHIGRFTYKREDVDCKLCTEYRGGKKCPHPICPYITERIEAGAVTYQDAIYAMIHPGCLLVRRLPKLILTYPDSFWVDDRHKSRMEFFNNCIYRFENNKPVFTILTRSPSEDIAMIHDRMPVILPQEALADWLNPHYSGSEILSAALTSMSFHAC